jgi:membrane fusion protein (multidrug efflux system)
MTGLRLSAALVLIPVLAADVIGAQEQQPAKRVRTSIVSSGAVSETIEAAGALKPWRDVTVASQVAGTVTAVHCHMGQRVGQGDVLVEVDDELARVAVQEASAAVERAEAQLRQSATDLERGEKLLETDDISESEWEMLSLRKHEASAALAAARAQLQRAERALRDTRIRTPFAGSVARRFVEVGTWITLGQPVARVVDLARMKAEFGIPQQRTPDVSVGMAAKLSADLYPGVTFSAEVIRVGVVADPASGQFSLEVAVPQSPSHPLRPGMAVRLELETRARNDAVLVPKSAIIDRGGDSYVLVVNRSRRAQLRSVKVGDTHGSSREVLSGNLRAGDVVITTGKDGVADGDRVEIEGTSR